MRRVAQMTRKLFHDALGAHSHEDEVAFATVMVYEVGKDQLGINSGSIFRVTTRLFMESEHAYHPSSADRLCSLGMASIYGEVPDYQLLERQSRRWYPWHESVGSTRKGYANARTRVRPTSMQLDPSCALACSCVRVT